MAFHLEIIKPFPFSGFGTQGGAGGGGKGVPDIVDANYWELLKHERSDVHICVLTLAGTGHNRKAIAPRNSALDSRGSISNEPKANNTLGG